MTDTIFSLEEAKKSRKRFVRSLEYELIAHLALQQYVQGGKPAFDRLLAIPMKDRVPGLVSEYGLKRMHRLIKLILLEFCYSIALPRSKKLTDTKVAVVACDLILTAEEDQLGLEDLIVFFELAKGGKYGSFQGLLTHFSIMQKFEQFRLERYNAFVKLKEEKDAALKAAGPTERISPQPTALRTLFDEDTSGRIIPLKKIS